MRWTEYIGNGEKNEIKIGFQILFFAKMWKKKKTLYFNEIITIEDGYHVDH